MVYHDPKVVAGGNLTNRQTPPSRAITTCPVPGTAFLHSYCDPETWAFGTIQRYTIVCEGDIGEWWTETAERFGVGLTATEANRAMRRPSIIQRTAFCRLDEICITTMRHTSEANCVSIVYFNQIMSSWNGAQSALEMVNTMVQGDTRHTLNFDLGGTSASVIMSDTNGTTPIEVDTFDVQAGTSGQAAPAEKQTTKCRDCIDLETDKFKPSTDFLKTDVRLLHTGALAGILWLAIMSG